MSKSARSGSTEQSEVQILEESVEMRDQHTKVVAWSSGKASEGGCDVFKEVKKVPKNVKKVTQVLKKKPAKKTQMEKDSEVKIPKLTVRQAALAKSKTLVGNLVQSDETTGDSSQIVKKKAIEDSKKRYLDTLAKERPEADCTENQTGLSQTGPAFQRRRTGDMQVLIFVCFIGESLFDVLIVQVGGLGCTHRGVVLAEANAQVYTVFIGVEV